MLGVKVAWVLMVGRLCEESVATSGGGLWEKLDSFPRFLVWHENVAKKHEVEDGRCKMGFLHRPLRLKFPKSPWTAGCDWSFPFL